MKALRDRENRGAGRLNDRRADRMAVPVGGARFSEEVDGVDVEILSLGIGGWTSAEANRGIRHGGPLFQPDLVVVHCVNNDMEPMRAMQPKVDYSHYRRAMNVVQAEAGAARFRQDAGDIVDAVVRSGRLYVYAKLFQSGQVPPRASLHALTTWNNDTQPGQARGVAIFERNLQSIAALASANGAQTVLATMPALSTKVPGIPMVPDGHLRSLGHRSRLRDLAEAEGWILADLALLSETLTPHYEDAIHVTMDSERIKPGVVDALTEAQVFGLGQPGSVTPTKRLRDRGGCPWRSHAGRLEHIAGAVTTLLASSTWHSVTERAAWLPPIAARAVRCFILADGHRNGAEGLHDHGGSDADGADGLARRVEGLEDALSVAVDAAV